MNISYPSQQNIAPTSAYVPREEYERLHEMYSQLQYEFEHQARLIQVIIF